MRYAFILCSALVAVLVLPTWAHADRGYHSTHIQLQAVDDAPLSSGFVENIHANGPKVYAHEVYMLRGADSDSSYEVRLLAYLFSPDCGGTSADFGAVTLTTNAAGNGLTDRFFAPGDVPDALRHATHGVRWQVELNGLAVYETGCNAITLD